MKIFRTLVLAIAPYALLVGNAAAADMLPRVNMKVAGSASTTNQFRKWEKPFFADKLPEITKGQMTADILGLDQMGLKGTQILSLLRLGVLDAARGVLTYFAGQNPAFEGLDLAGLSTDLKSLRKATDAYRPVIAELMEKNFNTKLLTLHPIALQTFYCKPEIKSLDDLKGRKIRVYNTTLKDFMGAVGASSVNIPFVEVVPSLQRGVADCGVTGTSNGNTARWWEVTNYLYTMPMSWGMTFYAANLKFWNKLDPKAREIMLKNLKEFEDNMWNQAAGDVQDGINCNTQAGKCVDGIEAKPAMKWVKPSENDMKKREEIVSNVVVKSWAKRCGADCVKRWNATVGKALNVVAAQ